MVVPTESQFFPAGASDSKDHFVSLLGASCQLVQLCCIFRDNINGYYVSLLGTSCQWVS